MAGDPGVLLLKSATVGVGAYATAAGAPGGGFVDVGFTDGPTSYQQSSENYKFSPEQVPGVIAMTPTDTGYQLKFKMAEVSALNLVTAFRQAAGNKSGTTPNFTFEIGEATEVYAQIQIVGRGPKTTVAGTYATRTITIWKAQVSASGPIEHSKKGPQMVEVTVECLYDPSVAAAGKFAKQVDASGT